MYRLLMTVFGVMLPSFCRWLCGLEFPTDRSPNLLGICLISIVMGFMFYNVSKGKDERLR